jgi:hypothetical protein
MKLSRTSRNALLSGLSNAFTLEGFETMLRDVLNKDLEKHLVIPGGLMAPNFGKVVEEVIKRAEERDWAPQLLIAALVEGPKDPDLLAAAGRILTGAQRLLPDLLRIIRNPGFNLNDGDVRRSYERCAEPGGSGEPRPLPEDVGGWSVLDYCYALAGRMARAGQPHPLLEFVKRLRREVSVEGVKDDFKGWLAAARRRLGAPSRVPRRREPSTSGARKRFLLVRVRDSVTEPGRYGIQAWLWDDAAGPGLLPEEAVVDEAGIEGVVDRIRESLVQREVDLKEVVIEVFLPRLLLDRAVDQWRVDPFVGRRGKVADLALPSESCLGTEHQVVLRPLDRISYGQALNDARSRWERARRILKGFTVRESAHGYRGKKLVAVRIRNGADGGPDIYPILRDNGVMCCLFDREPERPAHGVDPLDVWILTGVPAALWVRKPGADVDVAGELGRLVRDRRLDELPERVFRLRTDPTAPKEGWHLGRALTLLYDDPSRIPAESEDQSKLQNA